MQKSQFIKYNSFVLVALFFLIYLFFPSQNSSIDSYNYAANVKWQHDLFFPHHLLYNYFQFIVLKVVNLTGYEPSVLAFMKVINALFATCTLLVFINLLKLLKYDYKTIFALVLFAGSCFGFVRYATENETYIIPLFWSLLASFYYLKYLKSERTKLLILSGIYASIACLFHQIHIFWYIGLLFGTVIYRKDIKEAIFLSIPSVLILIIYFLAYKQDHFELNQAENLWQFTLYDYYYGTARFQFGLDNFILGFISFVRSFIQIHGIIPLLIKKINFYALVFIPFLSFSFFAILQNDVQYP